MEILNVPQGEFSLSRYPVRKKELLRAWDAADEYILNYINENINSDKKLNILIINDNFGALSIPLSPHSVTLWSDSYLTQQAVIQNAKYNHLDTDNMTFLESTKRPESSFDLIILKIPKSHALLEHQLILIKPLFMEKTNLIAAGMAKAIHTSTLKLFEKYIGDTRTSLAKKKARLIFSQDDPNIKVQKSPFPKPFILEGTEYTIINHANVFSREKLDIGTRFFLQYLPQSEKYKTIIDLACGNGVIGLLAAKKNPLAKVLFIDESFMAVESAKENFANAKDINNKAEFTVNDCLAEVEKNSADLILNNPPFHQNNAVGDEVAWQMFSQSLAVLKPGGELWVIGNRHLAYHIKLKKLFSNCETIAANKKFVILKSVKK